MPRIVRLVNSGVALAVVAGVLLAPAETGAQQYPAFLDDVRRAITSFPTGVLVSSTRIFSIEHGERLSQRPQGFQTTVIFGELWAALYPEESRARGAPAEFHRKAELLCAFKDADVAWLQLLEPAPDGVRPVTLSRNITPRLYVLPVVRGVPRVVTATFTGRYNERRLPWVEIQGTRAVDGWSGSPIVNTRGEVVGLLKGSTEEGSLITVALPVRTCDR